MNKYWWQEAVIYQGEEIGRTNIKFSESSDFDDIGKK